MAKQLKKKLGVALREQGHCFLTPPMWQFYRKVEAASVESWLSGLGGWVSVEVLDRCMPRYDGEKRARTPQTRRAWVRAMARAEYFEKGRGVARLNPSLLPPSPHLVDAETASERTQAILKATAKRDERADLRQKRRAETILRRGESERSVRTVRAIEAPRNAGGQFAPSRPRGPLASAMSPAELDEIDADIRRKEIRLVYDRENQKTQGHDAERRIPTPVPAPAADGSADADQPIYKNLWRLVEHYQQNPAAAERVRAESAAGVSGMPTKPPRPRLVAVKAPEQPRPTQVSVRSVQLPDDSHTADGTWLAFTLTRSKVLAPLLRSSLVKSGYNRGTWRAAVGGLLARAPGTIENPAGFIHGVMRSLVSGTERDPRTKLGYFPQEGWGKGALEFANVHVGFTSGQSGAIPRHHGRPS